MNVSAVVAFLYRYFGSRRIFLLLVTIGVIGAGLLGFRSLTMQENIAAMLPDGGRVAEDFRLLQQAPFANKMVITVSAKGEMESGDLVSATKILADSLDADLFTDVGSGPDERLQREILPWLLAVLPNLATEEDLSLLESQLDAAGVKARMEETYRSLIGLEGWALKGLIRQDPLGLHRLALEKMRHLNLVPGARLVEGYFFSPDGRSVLLVAETPVPMTDSAGAEKLLVAFEQAARMLPDTVEARLVSGHRYTAANAQAIQGDLWRILSVSILALAALFLIFLRSARAIFVFLIPVSVVCLAATAVGLVYREVSAVTIGFGAVLLGIAVDFGLHVYFALRRGQGDAATLVGKVSRPILFGGLTTIAAFSVLLFSDLPGQRQLALFSVTGIGAALILALVVLPHLLPVGARPQESVRVSSPCGRRRVILSIWVILLIFGAWQAGRVDFNGDLRSMSLVPKDLAADEAKAQQTWGKVRGHAMIWSLGEDLDQALTVNDGVFRKLSGHPSVDSLVSLATLLPPRAVQEENRRRWREFWTGPKGEEILTAMEVQASQLGFSSGAFSPFYAMLEKSPLSVTPDSLQDVGLADMVSSLVADFDDGRVGVLSLVPETLAGLEAIEEALEGLEGARIVAQGRFAQDVSASIQYDFTRFILSAGLVVILALAILFRRPRKILAALVPVVTGLVMMLGIMGALGMTFNLFNIVAAILVIGLGVDYGIFMVFRQCEGLDRSTESAVLVSGLTTLAGFGALVLATHPALHSIGVTVLLGIGAAIPAALLVIPALIREPVR
ncbi:MMPL family transporter [Geoalkalibacter halelectricus]|uniref:MMPL family transporter n=1 Tax=Geoalkalibacter halelectricus TaxID=2847045 RepID=A0ABY5ZJM8_9BACT|nr:MMPL family transporter [Geoalkalibacter halelectricus]MDO3379814.1 MMPL family transporter [Geoalkalibacter halelectricus]UWZ79248.1 MMPL family transporter [Geoalkalibacter halelectricus]